MKWFLFLTLLTTQGTVVFESLQIYSTEKLCEMEIAIIKMDYTGASGARIGGKCINEKARKEIEERIKLN